MKKYKFSDLEIGMKEEFKVKITEEMVSKFLEITNDTNPLHNNEEYALKHNYPGKVVYGMLTASLISTFGGCYIPGQYCLIQSVESKFLAPVFINDILIVAGEVIDLHESVQRVDIKIIMRNQNGTKVLKGLLKAGVLNE